ncbi:MAG TPA: MarR family transcriptional regulator [Conexibacter sp.]|nr:MarR family transcriptional regulator [Conexibacter sp.]
MLTVSVARRPPAHDDPELAPRLRLAITRMARVLRQEINRTGTEPSPIMAAALVTVEQEGPLTPSELADAERIQRPTATRVVATLAAAGFVTRCPDPSDGRVSRVAITPAGRAALKRIRSRKNEYLARQLRQLDADELAVLSQAVKILERLLA